MGFFSWISGRGWNPRRRRCVCPTTGKPSPATSFYQKRNGAQLSEGALKLILDFEVGGGRSYYDARLQSPTWPGASSGPTIGIGYDLGYRTASQIRDDWQGLIPERDLHRLLGVRGHKGDRGRLATREVRDIVIPWEAAFRVYQDRTIPEFMRRTKRAFPGVEKLHPNAFGALVSLVFNRGESMKGARRREMATIRELVKVQDYAGIAQEIRKMKRLWSYTRLRGLHRRRDAEAALVDSVSR